MNRIILIIVLVVAVIVISFSVWAILPYFTNTTIDEPIPTSTTIKTSDEVFRLSTDKTQIVNDFSTIGL
jgi:hypothetical protein